MNLRATRNVFLVAFVFREEFRNWKAIEKIIFDSLYFYYEKEAL